MTRIRALAVLAWPAASKLRIPALAVLAWPAASKLRIPALAVLARPAASKLRIPALALAALTAAATMTGCGAGSAVPTRIRGRKLTIYASVPLNGASSVSGRSVLDGAELALDSIHARIGRYRIVFRELDDSTVQAGGSDPGQTTANVHLAMLDPTTIGYLGEYNSGASAVSIPLLNRDDIPQISASSTAVGLTDGGPEASPGEPAKYYPTGRRTFARVVPSDAVQATVLADLQRSLGCTKTYVLDDEEVDGRDIAASFEVAAKTAGLNIVGSQESEPQATSYASLAAGIAQTGANCVLIAAITEHHAVLVTRQIAAALPDARIFGSAGLAESTYVDPALGGIPLSLDPRVLITVATLGPAVTHRPARRLPAPYTSVLRTAAALRDLRLRGDEPAARRDLHAPPWGAPASDRALPGAGRDPLHSRRVQRRRVDTASTPRRHQPQRRYGVYHVQRRSA